MWGAKMLKLIRGIADPVERAKLTEDQAKEEYAQAIEWMERAKAQFTASVQAGMDGDPGAEKMTRDALAAQEAARKQLAQAEATLAAIRDAKAQSLARREAEALEARWKRAGDLCKQRDKAAERLQRAAVEYGAAWRELLKLQGEILGTVPAAGRLSRVPTAWLDEARSAVEGQVFIASEGGLCREAAGHYTLAEFRGVAVDVPSKVRMQHRQILVRDGVKPINLQGDFDGPTAA